MVMRTRVTGIPRNLHVRVFATETTWNRSPVIRSAPVFWLLKLVSRSPSLQLLVGKIRIRCPRTTEHLKQNRGRDGHFAPPVTETRLLVPSQVIHQQVASRMLRAR